MAETTVGKILDEVKADLHARKENWKKTLQELKTRISTKDSGKNILISKDTIIGEHGKRSREITGKILGRKY